MAVSTFGSGIEPLDGRIEKGLDRVDLDIAAGEHARQQFGQVVALRDRQRARRAALVEPVAPGAAGRRILDAEEEAILSHWRDRNTVMHRESGASSKHCSTNLIRGDYWIIRFADDRQAQFIELIELAVLGADAAHGAGRRAHHHGLGLDHAVAES